MQQMKIEYLEVLHFFYIFALAKYNVSEENVRFSPS